MTPVGRSPLHPRWKTDLRLLWIGGVPNELTSSAVVFAEPLIVYRISGDLALTGLVIAIIAIVATSVGAVAGTFADRHNRKRIMVICHAAQIPVAIALAMMFLMGDVNILAFTIASIVSAVLGGYAAAPEAAALTQIAPGDEVAAASGQFQARMHVANLLGPTVGGVLLSLSPPLLYAASAGSAAIALFAIMCIRNPLKIHSAQTASFSQDFREGWVQLFRDRGVRAMVLMQFWANAGITGTLFATVLALQAAGHPSAVIGMAQTTLGVCGLIGASVVRYVTRSLSFALLQVLTMSAVSICAVIAGLLSGSMWMIAPLGFSVILAPSSTAMVFARIAERTDEDVRARVFSLQSLVASIGGSFVKAPVGAIGATSLALAIYVSAAISAPSIWYASQSRGDSTDLSVRSVAPELEA